MTQITNVIFILLITVFMSIFATILTVGIDRFLDIESFVKSIPHIALTILLIE
jgi:hypothetical protein